MRLMYLIFGLVALGATTVARAEPPAREMEKSFAFDLLAASSGEAQENHAVSPYGVASVLAGLDLSASASMRAAISKTLGLPPGEAGRKALEKLRRDARHLVVLGRNGGAFVGADSLLVDKSLPLKSHIADRIWDEIGIRPRELDFAQPEAIAEVNAQVAKLTEGKIASILEPSEKPAMVALNAFYFKSRWLYAFDPQATKPRPFAVVGADPVERSMMSLEEHSLPYANKGRYLAADLPYADERFSLILVTTNDKPAPLAEFAAARSLLSGAGMKNARIIVDLPSFSIHAGSDLLAPLSKLGLADGLADGNQFPQLADGLTLSALRQKIVITVREEGTEAAATTAGLASRSISALQDQVVRLRFDKPFVYALRERQSGLILAIGYVADPGDGN